MVNQHITKIIPQYGELAYHKNDPKNMENQHITKMIPIYGKLAYHKNDPKIWYISISQK